MGVNRYNVLNNSYFLLRLEKHLLRNYVERRKDVQDLRLPL